MRTKKKADQFTVRQKLQTVAIAIIVLVAMGADTKYYAAWIIIGGLAIIVAAALVYISYQVSEGGTSIENQSQGTGENNAHHDRAV